MKNILLLLLLDLLLFAEIGKVVAVKGEAYITRKQKQILIKNYENINLKDTIETKQGKLQIRFIDNTIVTLGKESVFQIKNYQFAKNKKENLFQMDIKKGLFKSITGSIGKLNPEKFKIKTKTSTIGIRGTTIFVNSQPKQPDIIACLAGTIDVTSLATKVTVTLPAGKITNVSEKEAPTPPRDYKTKEIIPTYQKTNIIEKKKEDNKYPPSRKEPIDIQTPPTKEKNIDEKVNNIIDSQKNKNPVEDIPTLPEL
ncbi:MAG: FecR family protein [Campylobacterales bacterium]|nr:FecR family protein [Campylobacterales bacterium]